MFIFMRPIFYYCLHFFRIGYGLPRYVRHVESIATKNEIPKIDDRKIIDFLTKAKFKSVSLRSILSGRLGPDVLGGAGVAISAQYAVSKLYNDPLLRTSISLVASIDGQARATADNGDKDEVTQTVENEQKLSNIVKQFTIQLGSTIVNMFIECEQLLLQEEIESAKILADFLTT